MKKSYKDLEVWQLSMDLTIQIYEFTQTLPSEEKFALSDQMRRAAVSIPSNIAEGMGRGHNKELIHFLYIAKGSVFELETQIEICKRLHFINEMLFDKLQYIIASINRMLNSLISFYSKN